MITLIVAALSAMLATAAPSSISGGGPTAASISGGGPTSGPTCSISGGGPTC